MAMDSINNEADNFFDVKSKKVYQRNVKGPKKNKLCVTVKELFNIICNVYVRSY